jgi:ferric enterobactin receptor
MQSEFKPSFYFYDLNSKLTITPSERDRIAFSFYSGKDNLDKSQDFSNMQFQRANSDVSLGTTDYTKWGNVGFSGNWSRQWSDRFHLNFLGAFSNYFSDYDRSTDINGFAPPAAADSSNRRVNFGNATKEHNSVQDASFKLDADWHIARAHRLRFGLHSTNLSNSYSAMANDTLSIFSRANQASLNAAYLQDKWNLKKLEITAGIRGSHYDKTNAFYWEPRAALSYPLSSTFTARAAWGQYYQFVNQIVNEDVTQGARDFWLLADKDLKPSFAEHYIAGLSYENLNYVFSVEAYQKNLKDIIEFSRRIVTRFEPGRPGQPIENFFVGDGMAQGVEILLQKKKGALTGWLGYTLGRINHTFPDMNNGNTFPALHDRTHELNVVSKYTLGVYTFAATWVYATGSPYTAPESQYFVPLLDGSTQSYIHVSDKNSLRLPDYHRLDLSVSRKFESNRWATEVGLSIFNAYNHKNIWYRDYNLDTTPITVTDVLMLGFTPTIFAQFNLK